MSQEDDLRGLAKVMDFMRALSVLFVVVNIYWFCYPSILGVERQYRSGGQDSAELPAHDRIVRLHPLDKTLLRYLPCSLVSGDERRKGGKNQMGACLDSPFRRFRPLLFQLVVARTAHTVNGTHRLLYIHSYCRLPLPARCRCMDLPSAQTESHGRCIQ